ncbi:GTP-binding protein [Photobacterium leiognathi]|uniref:GTP-binding protein n=1 Tax=Photobacterium leiognathi TaxID=553611 RepID=UPI0027360A64|nr:GTP-binding protein [Photobacterium leiognathi]
MLNTKDIRNIAIVAHVDHGKTSLVDQLLRQADALTRRESTQRLVMDCNAQEQERGITILSKVTAIDWKGVRINIIDTPGHADFGGEVERVIDMANAVLVIVDAVEGPMPQTRFVAQKAINKGLKLLVAVNKVDRPEAQPEKAIDQLYDLFVTLGADCEQLDFPAVSCSAKEAFAYDAFGEVNTENGMASLLDMLVDNVASPTVMDEQEPVIQIHQLDYSEYLGLIGIGRVISGSFHRGQKVAVNAPGEDARFCQIKEVYHQQGLSRVAVDYGVAGDIIALTGISDIAISDIVTSRGNNVELEALEIDTPTVSVKFSVNDSPFSGQEGKVLQSRELAERLYLEASHNVSLHVAEAEDAGVYEVSGRGELHLGVLIESMRREGYEFSVSRPTILMKSDAGKTQEPYEKCYVDCANEFMGKVIEEMAYRKAQFEHSQPLDNSHQRLLFLGPKRGLLGIRHTLLSLTEGSASIHKEDVGYGKKIAGDIGCRREGVLVSNGIGKALIYSLSSLQERGRLMINHGDQVYQGQIIGAASNDNDLWVNCRQGKNLVRMWRTVADKNYAMKAIMSLSLEQALTWINSDELIEVTPKAIRLRKAMYSF